MLLLTRTLLRFLQAQLLVECFQLFYIKFALYNQLKFIIIFIDFRFGRYVTLFQHFFSLLVISFHQMANGQIKEHLVNINTPFILLFFELGLRLLRSCVFICFTLNIFNWWILIILMRYGSVEELIRFVHEGQLFVSYALSEVLYSLFVIFQIELNCCVQ